MRISDWSSDVCSSDLVIAVGGIAPLRQQLPDALPVDQRDREDRASLDADVEQVRARTQPELLRDQQVPGRGDRQEFGDSLDDAEQYDVRSEEHTSELQSLMRTLNPVFCLKKKIKKQQ